MNADTSAFAFPQTPAVSAAGDVYDPSDRYGGGMTQRDWLAGQAIIGMAGYLLSTDDDELDNQSATLAAHAYRLADALLAERVK